MKIKYFFVAVMFVTISAARVSAQEVSSKGFYFNFSGGYSFSAGTSSGAGGLVPTHNTTSVSSSDYYSRFGNVTQDESSGSSTKSNAKISLGQGIDVNVGIGYMFNSNIGFELNGDYLTGIGNTVESTSSSRQYRNVAVSVGNNNARATITQSSNSNSTTYKLTRSSLSLTPALKLVVPLGVKSAVYSRIGVVLPVSDNLNYEYSSSQSQSSSSSDTYNTSAAYNYSNSSFSSEI
jgi:hypothetical protein